MVGRIPEGASERAPLVERHVGGREARMASENVASSELSSCTPLGPDLTTKLEYNITSTT
jgi:hypothetical protein